MATSYYEVLGIARSATADEIRQAYRRRARSLHPDRQFDADRTDEGPGEALRAMQLLNEAWHVLGDRDRRVAYDRQGGPGGPGEEAFRRPAVRSEDNVADVDLGGGLVVSLVRGLPWIAVLVVLGGIFVFTAFASGSGTSPGVRSASDLVGRCVQLERAGVINTVPCDGPNDGRVDLVAARASLCPEGADVARLASQASWLCLRNSDPG